MTIPGWVKGKARTSACPAMSSEGPVPMPWPKDDEVAKDAFAKEHKIK